MAFCIYPSHSETRLHLMMSVMLPWRYNISTSRKNDPCQYRKIQRPTSHLRSQYYYCGVLDAFGVTKDCQFSEFRRVKSTPPHNIPECNKLPSGKGLFTPAGAMSSRKNGANRKLALSHHIHLDSLGSCQSQKIYDKIDPA